MTIHQQQQQFAVCIRMSLLLLLLEWFRLVCVYVHTSHTIHTHVSNTRARTCACMDNNACIH